MTNLDCLLIALNDHVVYVKSQGKEVREVLHDATFLGTLQLKTHRFLIEAALDQHHPTEWVKRSLYEFGDVWVQRGELARVQDAIRLVSQLRAALIHQPNPSSNVQAAMALWVSEVTPDKRQSSDLPRDGGWLK